MLASRANQRLASSCQPRTQQVLLVSKVYPRRRQLSVAAAAAVGASQPEQGGDALYLADISASGDVGRTPLTLGIMGYLQRHLTSGFFVPIGRAPLATSEAHVDRSVELICKACDLKDDPHSMIGVEEDEAHKMIAKGQVQELVDKIYSAFAKYKETKQMTLLSGPGVFMGDTELDAQLAAALSTPVVLSMNGDSRLTVEDYFNHVMMKRQVFLEHKVNVLGVALNRVPRAEHSLVVRRLKEKLEKSGVHLAGALPEDALLANVRLDEVVACLGAKLLFGERSVLDKDFRDIIVASQSIEELLEVLDENTGSLPLVITSMDRLDIVLGLLASQLSVKGPSVAGILLTRAGSSLNERRYARDTVTRIFDGLEHGLYKGTLLPVLHIDEPIYNVLAKLQNIESSILATSTNKIQQCKMLFDRYIDANSLVAGYNSTKEGPSRVTPQLFQYHIKAACLRNPQHIVLPESGDKRVLQAAAEVTQRGLARITLLGDPDIVRAEGKRLGLDLSLCNIVSNVKSPRFDAYVDALVEARKKKGLQRDVAVDTVRGDENMYGVMMVYMGDADGMVSGAIHTTAATVRPAMQVLKNDALRVSSVFFMCLPDRVLVYGDCAVNMNPSSEELAQIAMVSADTAQAFGVEPRVAMLSYSTLGSGEGPDVKKVVDAVALVKKLRPSMMVEGPIQYDAAIDPKVAAVKVKQASDVAGKATVFIFPDLNTGNNTYKAVQQATGAVAMGPVMQGLNKPVNDLSRGCTVADIVNTICVTSVQALQSKRMVTIESLDEAEEQGAFFPSIAAAAEPSKAAV